MINELYLLHRSLEICGITAPKWHKWIKSLGRTEGIVACIESDGSVASVEYRNADDMSCLWKIEKNNFNSFPALNLEALYWRIDSANSDLQILLENTFENDSDRILFLKNIRENNRNTYKEADKKRLKTRIHNFPDEFLPLMQNGNTETQIVVELASRLKNIQIDEFLYQLSLTTINACIRGELSWELALKMHLGERKKDRFQKATVPVVLDLQDYHKYKYRIADPALKTHVNKCLLREEPIGSTLDICALTGKKDIIETEKFDNPKLPVLGLTYLISMNKDAECHYRYKAIGPEIFPTGKKSAATLSNAIRFLTEQNKAGRTWQSVPSHKKAKNDLLISYLVNKPDCGIALASMFSESRQEQKGMEVAVYESVAAHVCKLLRAEPSITENSHLNLLVLTRFDTGRVQLLLDESLTVSRVIHAFEKWRLSSDNHPLIYVQYPSKQDEDRHIATPLCPSPASVMRTMKHQWIKEGTDSRDIPGCSLREVYDVYLSDPPHINKTAFRLLNMGLMRMSSLLLGIGGVLNANISTKFKYDKYKEQDIKNAMNCVAILAILLFKLDRRKEVYMKEAAFYTGRMMSLADTLHREYCVHVRKKDVPPQLIGNALMPTALENPRKGIARLSQRIMIYQAWANKAQGEKVGLAKWTLTEMGKVSDRLAEFQLPDRADDTDKAEMLLGYLARKEKSEETK